MAVLIIAAATHLLDGPAPKVGRLSGGNYFFTYFDTADNDLYIRIAATIAGLAAAGDQTVLTSTGGDSFGHAARYDGTNLWCTLAWDNPGNQDYLSFAKGTVAAAVYTSVDTVLVADSMFGSNTGYPDIWLEDGGEPFIGCAGDAYWTADVAGWADAAGDSISADFTEVAGFGGGSLRMAAEKEDGAEEIHGYSAKAFNHEAYYSIVQLSDHTQTRRSFINDVEYLMLHGHTMGAIGTVAYFVYVEQGSNNLRVRTQDGDAVISGETGLAADAVGTDAGASVAVCRDENTDDLYVFYASTDNNEIKCYKWGGASWDEVVLIGDAVDGTNAKTALNCARIASDTIFLVWTEDGDWVGQDVVDITPAALGNPWYYYAQQAG